MPETDEITPSLTPANAPQLPMLSPLHLPGKDGFAAEPRMRDFDLNGPLSPSGKAAASALFVLSSASRAVRAPLNLLGTKRCSADEDDEKMSKRIRSSRCGTCANCLKPDCGECINCSDKPKFGGPGVKKQACSQRKCLCPNRALNFHDDEAEGEEDE